MGCPERGVDWDKWKLPQESSAKWSKDAVGGNGLSLITVLCPADAARYGSRLRRNANCRSAFFTPTATRPCLDQAGAQPPGGRSIRQHCRKTTYIPTHCFVLIRIPTSDHKIGELCSARVARFHRNLSVQDKLNMVLAQQWEPRTIKHPGSSIASQSLEDRRFAGDPPEPLL